MDPKIEKLLVPLGEAASSLRDAHAPERRFSMGERFLLLAAAALDMAEANHSDSAGDAGQDTSRGLRRIRKLLMGELRLREAREDSTRRSRAESEEMERIASEKKIDLGQYSQTLVFSGDTRKAEKFAKLMGGAKAGGCGSGAGHNTMAPDSGTVERINRDIEDQYNAALSHKGKKGLGA